MTAPTPKTFDIRHGLKVASQFRPGSVAWVIGLLHDAMEDAGVEYNELFEAGLTSQACSAIERLTRREGESYALYIERVARDPLASMVKQADLRVNLERMDEAHESLRPRYEKALARLSE